MDGLVGREVRVNTFGPCDGDVGIAVHRYFHGYGERRWWVKFPLREELEQFEERNLEPIEEEQHD